MTYKRLDMVYLTVMKLLFLARHFKRISDTSNFNKQSKCRLYMFDAYMLYLESILSSFVPFGGIVSEKSKMTDLTDNCRILKFMLKFCSHNCYVGFYQHVLLFNEIYSCVNVSNSYHPFYIIYHTTSTEGMEVYFCLPLKCERLTDTQMDIRQMTDAKL